MKLDDNSLPYNASLDPEKEPDAWVLASVWCGTGSLGNQAEAAIKRLAAANKITHPLAMEPLTMDRYVDDIQGGSHTPEEMDKQICQTMDVLAAGGLKLIYIGKLRRILLKK